MNAFIAWTPLHIMNILNTVLNYYANEKNDIYIYDEFENAKELYSKIKETKLFNKVFLVEHHTIKNSKFKIVPLLIGTNPFKLKTIIYDRMFIEGDNYFAKVLYSLSKKSNNNLILNYIEDGIGAYVGSKILDRDSRNNKLISKFNKNSMYRYEIDELYLYEPSLVQQRENKVYKTLPKLNEENEAYKFIEKIFNIAGKGKPTKQPLKYIFLDQPFQQDGSQIDEVEIFQFVKNTIKQNEELVVKLHPRSDAKKYGNANFLDTNVPWEIYCLTENIEKTRVISMASTASFTPSLMFGKSTNIIYLAKIIKEYYLKKGFNSENQIWLENTIDLAEEFKKNVSDNIHIPASQEELEVIIDAL